MGLLKKENLPAYTYEDYLQWQGDWELIEAIPYSMSPAPVKNHQMLVLAIGSEILSKIGNCPSCEMLINEDWKLDTSTILKLDVAVVCNDENPNYITKTPEIIFEVLSPSTAKRDEGLKFELYQDQGVKYYCLVYPDDLIAKIYQDNGEKLLKVAECDTEEFEFTDVTCTHKLNFSTVFKCFRM